MSHAGEKTGQGGFTLIEVMVVIVILGLLAGLVGPRLIDRVSGAKRETARSQIELLTTALDNYRLDNGRYPTTRQGLEALWTRPDAEPVPESWSGPYVRKEVPLDPWGHPFVYRFPADSSRFGFDLVSLGADGEPGGTEEAADVANWE